MPFAYEVYQYIYLGTHLQSFCLDSMLNIRKRTLDFLQRFF